MPDNCLTLSLGMRKDFQTNLSISDEKKYIEYVTLLSKSVLFHFLEELWYLCSLGQKFQEQIRLSSVPG